MIKQKAFVSLALSMLAGCTSIYTADMTPKQRVAAAYDYCIKDVETWNINLKQEAMSFMRVSRQQLPGVFCTRVIKAVAAGRLTIEDNERLRRGQTTAFFKVIKGQ